MSSHRIAFIGSRGHWEAASRDLVKIPNVQVVALSPGGDTIAPVAAWWAKPGHHPPVVEDDYRAMLNRARPDVVVVCGPFELHAQMCIDAIECGVHVLIEKPAALTFEQLDALREAHRKHSSVHLAGMMFSRYDPGFFAAARLIREGSIGDVRLINARKSYKLGRRAEFYHDRATYGGTIPWVGSHAIDWAMWFAGDARFETVCATHSAEHNPDNGTMERAALCQFTMTGGRAASISIDVLRPESAPTHDDDWARVVGTSGVIEVHPKSVVLLNANNNGAVADLSCDQTLFGDFIDHIDGRGPAMLNAESTLALTEACLRARQSADERRMVRFQ
jgi:predicted dehydrogenase